SPTTTPSTALTHSVTVSEAHSLPTRHSPDLGAINYNNVVNFNTSQSTQTKAGAAPGAPSFIAVYVSSATVQYGTVSNSTGYELDRSRMSTLIPLTTSSSTTDNTRNALTFNLG